MPDFAPGMLVHVRPDAPILEFWGNGQSGVILFYPGTMLAPGHYKVLVAELKAAGFFVAGLHLSGHGECLAINDFVFSELLAQGLFAEAWLRSNGFTNIAVCGHSQGGILALAHACASRTLTAAFAISAVFPRMPDAIGLTRFASLAGQRQRLLRLVKQLAAVLPGLPVPLPAYLELRKILSGKKPPLHIGKTKGRSCYPLRYLASLFDADISGQVNCPFWLFNARDDALFTEGLINAVFAKIKAKSKNLVWLENGGHLLPLNPIRASFIARTMAAAAAGLGMPLNLRSGGR